MTPSCEHECLRPGRAICDTCPIKTAIPPISENLQNKTGLQLLLLPTERFDLDRALLTRDP